MPGNTVFIRKFPVIKNDIFCRFSHILTGEVIAVGALAAVQLITTLATMNPVVTSIFIIDRITTKNRIVSITSDNSIRTQLSHNHIIAITAYKGISIQGIFISFLNALLSNKINSFSLRYSETVIRFYPFKLKKFFGRKRHTIIFILPNFFICLPNYFSSTINIFSTAVRDIVRISQNQVITGTTSYNITSCPAEQKVIFIATIKHIATILSVEPVSTRIFRL